MTESVSLAKFQFALSSLLYGGSSGEDSPGAARSKMISAVREIVEQPGGQEALIAHGRKLLQDNGKTVANPGGRRVDEIGRAWTAFKAIYAALSGSVPMHQVVPADFGIMSLLRSHYALSGLVKNFQFSSEHLQHLAGDAPDEVSKLLGMLVPPDLPRHGGCVHLDEVATIANAFAGPSYSYTRDGIIRSAHVWAHNAAATGRTDLLDYAETIQSAFVRTAIIEGREAGTQHREQLFEQMRAAATGRAAANSTPAAAYTN